MFNPEYSDHVKKLRKNHACATISQRLKSVRDRVENMDSRPNNLIVYASAIEGLSRTLLVKIDSKKNNICNEVSYEKYKRKPPEEMLEQLKNVLKWDIDKLFGAYWSDLEWIFEYRNLFVHDCTFCDQSKSQPLIISAENILKALVKEAEKMERGEYDNI